MEASSPGERGGPLHRGVGVLRHRWKHTPAGLRRHKGELTVALALCHAAADPASAVALSSVGVDVDIYWRLLKASQ